MDPNPNIIGLPLIAGQAGIIAENAEATADVTNKQWRTIRPATGEELPELFHSPTATMAAKAVELAQEAFDATRNYEPYRWAELLRTIADELEKAKDDISARYSLEAGEPTYPVDGRCLVELDRTCWQLRLMAIEVESQAFRRVTIDTPHDGDKPFQRSVDSRSMMIARGVVVVLTSSNFVLGFGPAGNDVASALAAGCPVVVSAHRYSAGTAELIGHAINRAVKKCNMPAGIFSLLTANDDDINIKLVENPLVRAVGFTGSKQGAAALRETINRKNDGTVLYEETGSVNPVAILPGAQNEGTVDALLKPPTGAVVMGGGQFCTQPGMSLVLYSDETTVRFQKQMVEAARALTPYTLLHPNFVKAYNEGIERLMEAGASVVATSSGDIDEDKTQVAVTLLEVSATNFLSNPIFQQEVFGPCHLIVQADDWDQMLSVANALETQLTVTVRCSNEEEQATNDEFDAFLAAYMPKGMRSIWNGMPTGVCVIPAMAHGNSREAGGTTSIGSQAITRWCTVQNWQAVPEARIPKQLWLNNPLNVEGRTVNGKLKLAA